MPTHAIAIAGALACAMLCDSVAIAADGGAAVHAPLAPAEAAAVASDMRVGGDDKQTRVVVDLNRKIDLAAFTLADPYRVVVD
ncbi:MAG: N-acetylmuramoyl-L-alanine amidase, partial [Pseudolabrys sp.]